tara:strand:+ start:2277 stop:5549 length:3273 start_codon:yes stop_codon:yes gene_type:complete
MAENLCQDAIPAGYRGDGSTTKYSFAFQYINKEDILVYLWNDTTNKYVLCTEVDDAASCTGSTTEYYFTSSTPVELYFCVAPGLPPIDKVADFKNVFITRETDICNMVARFFPGTSIRAQDLNNDFTQILLALQEVEGKVQKSLAEAIIGIDQLDRAGIIEESEMLDSQTFSQWDDTKISTAGAQKRFFQPLQAAVKPPVDEIFEPGKLWYQEYTTADGKEVQSFNIWNGNQWRNIASGQVIPNAFQPDSVIYVDPQGNDNNPGRQKDEAYRTIGAAVKDANEKVPSTVSTVTAATYNNVSGFINIQTAANHNLIAGYTITLSPIVWSCTEGSKSYPLSDKEFRVSSIVTPFEFRIYVGPTELAHTYVSGGIVTPLDVRKGDGYTIQCAPGVYHEKLPIRIEAKNLSIIGKSLRNTYIHPDIYESSSSDGGSGRTPYESPDRVLMTPIGQQQGVDIYEQELQIMFEMDSGSYLTGFTMCGLKSLGVRGGGSVDPDPTYGLPPQQGWVSAHRNVPEKSFITKSPYIQNCTHFSDLQTNNADFDINFLAGEGGDTSSGPAGGGILVDGNRVNPSSPLRSYVVDSFTQIALGGPGVLCTNNGYAQLVSFFGTFCWYHAKSLNGGQLNLSNCTTDFGQYGLIADGKSPLSIFNGSLKGDASKGDQFFQVDSFTRGAGWDVPRVMSPVDNMVVEVGGVLYPILASRKNADGYEINIFAPKSDESAVKIPANASNVVNAAYNNETGFVTITTDKSHSLLAGRTAFISPMTWSCPAPNAGTDQFPQIETEFKVQDVTGSTTFIIYVGPNDKVHNYVSGGVVTPTDINPDTFENGGLQKDSPDNTTVKFYLQSYISTGGHTMEFVGSGTDYRAHPDFGGVPKPENQTLEVGGVGSSGSRLAYLNGGRVWLSSTDENGNFKVGETFTVNQKTGSIYILPEAVKSAFRLTDDLDLRGYKIWQDPATAGRNADIQLQPSGTGAMVFGTEDINSDGERITPSPIMAPILEQLPDGYTGINQKDLNLASPVVTQNDIGYDANEVPVSGLLGELAFTNQPVSVGLTTEPPIANEVKFELVGSDLIIKVAKSDGTVLSSSAIPLT